MQESLRRCHEARGALQRHVDGLAGVFDRAQARLDSVPVDDAAKAEMLRLAKGSSGHEDAERRAIADLDKASFGAMEDIARLLRSRRGHWGVEGGRFMFDDAATLQHYNRQLEHLRAFELQESKLLTGSSPRNANATSM